MGRGCVGKHESPTLTPASAAPRQASGAAISRQGPLLKPAIRSPPPKGKQLAAALLFFLQEEIRNRSIQALPGALLSLGVKSAQPCQAPLLIREARLRPQRGRRPASSPPGPLPANQVLIDAGVARQCSPCSVGPAAAPPQKGAQPSVPASLKPSGQKVGDPCSQHSGLSSRPPGRLLGEKAP